MPNLPTPNTGTLDDRLAATRDAIASGAFDPVGANSTTFKPGSGPGDTAPTKPGPTTPANYLLAAADLKASGNLSMPVPTGRDPIKPESPRSKLKVVK